MASDPRISAPFRWRILPARRRYRVLLALIVVLIGIRAALPYVIRRVAIAQADKALVGRLELDDVDLALLSGGITLHGLRVFANEAPASPPAGESPPASDALPSAGESPPAIETSPSAGEPPPPAAGHEPPGTAPIFAANRLAVKLGFLALFRKTVEVQQFELEGFAISVDRTKAGTVILPQPVPASETPPPPAAEARTNWGVLVRRVTLRDGRAGFRDFAIGDPPQHIDVTIPTIDAANLALLITDSGVGPGKMTLDAAIKEGALHVETTIENLAAGPSVETHVVVTSLPIGDARLYIPNVGWSDLAGQLDTDLVHRFESQGAHTLRGTIALRDLGVRVADVDQPVLAWRSLTVDLGGIDIVKQHAEINTVALAGLRAVTEPSGPDPLPVLRGLLKAAKEKAAAQPPPDTAGSADDSEPPRATPQADVAANPAAGTEPAADAANARPWTWTIAKADLDDAAVKAIGGEGPLDVAINAEVAGVASAPGSHSRLRLVLEPSGAGSITIEGDLTREPIGFDGTLALDHLALPPLTRPVATAQTRLLKSGRASADLHVAAGAAASAPQNGVRLTGKIALEDFEVSGDDPKLFALRWKELAVALREVTAPGVLATDPSATSEPIAAAMAQLTLVRPEIVATRTEAGIALPEALGGTPASTQPPAAPGAAAQPSAPKRARARSAAARAAAPSPVTRATPPAPSTVAPAAAAAPAPAPAGVQVRIDRIAIEKMAVAVTDKTVQPFYRSTLDPVDFSASDVRWPGPFARDVKLVAKGLDGATFTMTGNVAPTGSQLVAKLDRLPLSPFNPYAVASGYGIGGGTAQLESKIELGPNSYNTTSKLVLNKLDVRGSAGDSLFAAQFGMPLSLALSLLTDLQGNIVIDLPIAGDEKGMRIALGTIIANALAQAILHAVTSPLKLIGAIANIGDKPAAIVPPPIVFQPGREVLAAGEEQKLEQLGKLLSAAPGLSLHLRGEAAAEDRRWLQEQALREKLEKESGVLGSVRHVTERGPRKATLEVLNARANGTAAEIPEEHKPWFEEQVAAQQVSDQALQALAAARATTVQTRLEREEGIGKGRLVLDTATPEDLNARPVVAIGLGSEPARVPRGEATAAGAGTP